MVVAVVYLIGSDCALSANGTARDSCEGANQQAGKNADGT